MNAAQYDSGSWCGKSITITNTELGKSTTATVVDQCPGCAYGSLDMSQSLFSDLSNNNLAEGCVLRSVGQMLTEPWPMRWY